MLPTIALCHWSPNPILGVIKVLFVALACVYLVSAAPAVEEKPEPYAFQFESTDEQGNAVHTRQEQGDDKGVIQGSYTVTDAEGHTRTVQYIADDDGFRATVTSNEPGLVSSAPAGVTYSVQ